MIPLILLILALSFPPMGKLTHALIAQIILEMAIKHDYMRVLITTRLPMKECITEAMMSNTNRLIWDNTNTNEKIKIGEISRKFIGGGRQAFKLNGKRRFSGSH